MSTIKKVIEVLASSEKSFEDAVQRALADASTTVKGIRSIYIKDQSCRVRDNKIAEYRITAKITFDISREWNPNQQNMDASVLEETDGTGGGAPDYSNVEVKTHPDLPRDVEPGGSATAPESGGGYSG